VPQKQDKTAVGGDLLEVFPGPQESPDGLFDVDDMDQISAAINVRPHLGIPPAGTMTEMDSGIQNVLNDDFRHDSPFLRRPPLTGSLRGQAAPIRHSLFLRPLQINDRHFPK
jgi:hypothetical protein